MILPVPLNPFSAYLELAACETLECCVLLFGSLLELSSKSPIFPESISGLSLLVIGK